MNTQETTKRAIYTMYQNPAEALELLIKQNELLLELTQEEDFEKFRDTFNSFLTLNNEIIANLSNKINTSLKGHFANDLFCL